MSVQEQEVYNLIKDLPVDAYSKVIDYIFYIRYTLNLNETNHKKKRFEVDTKEELYEKLEEARADEKNGALYSAEEALAEVKKILE